MRKVDHVLIKHGVRVAKYKRISVLVLRLIILIVKFLASRWKKHSIYLYVAIFNKALFSVKSFAKHQTHLLWLPKHCSKTAATIISSLSTTVPNRFYWVFAKLQKLQGDFLHFHYTVPVNGWNNWRVELFSIASKCTVLEDLSIHFYPFLLYRFDEVLLDSLFGSTRQVKLRDHFDFFDKV